MMLPCHSEGRTTLNSRAVALEAHRRERSVVNFDLVLGKFGERIMGFYSVLTKRPEDASAMNLKILFTIVEIFISLILVF
jgi:hypothetical protein